MKGKVMMQTKIKKINSFFLHILAMMLMLCDHLWATLFPAQEWLTCVGRMAFPIFSFMIVEGYFHTSNINKYTYRLLIFAIISEIPFNLIYGSSLIYPFHQNVIWTFLFGLISIRIIAKAKTTKKIWLIWIISIITIIFDCLLGLITMTDYFSVGILTVLVFYFFHDKKWWCFLGQFICLAILNIGILGGYYYSISFAGHEIQIIQQGFALFSLIPIWLYNGEKGYCSKIFQYFCYVFYPAHLLILYLIWQCVI